jgi:SAM-dependent methyltransferase
MKLRNRIDLIKTSISLLGVKETFKAILVLVFSYNPEKDRAFDKRHKTDTAVAVGVDDLNISDKQTCRAAVSYISAPVKFERCIIGTLDIDYENFDFIDIGCGKGRVLMLASEKPFRSVIGVEISKELCSIAEKNLQIYRSLKQKCTKVQVYCMDARLFPIENENTIFHFYHPFQADVLKPILENIVSRFRGKGKKVFIVYIWMQLTDIFTLFEELHFTRLRYIQTLNRRYQYAIFTL